MVVDDGPGVQSKSSAANTCAAREKPTIVLNVIVLEQQVFLLRWHAEPRIISLISETMSFAKLQEILLLARSNSQHGHDRGMRRMRVRRHNLFVHLWDLLRACDK